MDLTSEISASVLCGDCEKVEALIRRAIETAVPAAQVLNDGLRAGMLAASAGLKSRELFLPDVLMAAKAMRIGIKLLEPYLVDEDVRPWATVVLGSVQGDLHDIGKNLVAIMLEGAGFEVIDLGIDVAPEAFTEAADREGATVIGMSSLLTTTMPVMESVVGMVGERGLAGKVKTIVGGAPVSADFARTIGADAYAFDAVSAVNAVKQLAGVSQ